MQKLIEYHSFNTLGKDEVEFVGRQLASILRDGLVNPKTSK